VNAEVIELFKRHFGHKPPHVVQAPGRLELLGNHTDYNLGLVLSLAVDKCTWMAISPRTDGRIEVVSSAYHEKETFRADQFEKDAKAPWSDYIKGVLLHFRRRGVRVRGFNAAVHSTIPLGAGLSSSAALEVATALAIRKICPYSFTASGAVTVPRGDAPPLTTAEKLEVAKVCQAAENDFVGVKCGLLDQISSLFGKAFHAIETDFQSLSVERVPMIGEISIAVCNTGVKHALVGGEYNALRELCESAASKLGVKVLRRVDMTMLKANRGKLSEREYQCAYHIIGENQRVIFGARALRDSDFAQFGQYMYQSHESSREFFHNSTRELDLLVSLAQDHAACLGARLTGGGFGGATINLVQRSQVAEFCESIATQYREQTGIETAPMICQTVDGAN
jgi:galactokinase